MNAGWRGPFENVCPGPQQTLKQHVACLDFWSVYCVEVKLYTSLSDDLINLTKKLMEILNSLYSRLGYIYVLFRL